LSDSSRYLEAGDVDNQTIYCRDYRQDFEDDVDYAHNAHGLWSPVMHRPSASS
jgi:hypothetical protein